MATKQITDYSAKTALESTDQFLIQETGGTTKKTTTAELGTISGWIPAGETWTYASADSPTFTFTITGNYTTKYSVGMKLRLTQTTVKYFIITAISYSDPSTTVTVYGGTDYTLTSAAITSPYYSMVKAPYGFPMSSDKWTVKASGGHVYKNNPTAGVWYGGANAWDSGSNVTISVPIGEWRVKMFNSAESIKTGAQCDIIVYLSTSNSTGVSFYFYVISGYQVIKIESPIGWQEILSITTKTDYYLLAAATIASTDSIRMYWSNIYLECAYL